MPHLVVLLPLLSLQVQSKLVLFSCVLRGVMSQTIMPEPVTHVEPADVEQTHDSGAAI